jgi:hypothetical protein
MVTAEMQRTLVKSPPELWGELSDQAALARHLAGLGEIRIVASEPEQSLEWEAATAHGKVEIKPAGWGTKVTLSATVDGASGTVDGTERMSSESHGELDGDLQAPADAESRGAPDPEPQVEPDAEPQAPSRLFSRVRWRGWFARKRRRAELARSKEPELARAPKPEAVSVPQLGTVSPQVTEGDPGPEPPGMAAAEQQARERTTELLRAVLDSLGEAHHRPFSRA